MRGSVCVCSSLNLALRHEEQPVDRERDIIRARRILQHPIPSTLNKFIQPPGQSLTGVPNGITLFTFSRGPPRPGVVRPQPLLPSVATENEPNPYRTPPVEKRCNGQAVLAYRRHTRARDTSELHSIPEGRGGPIQ